MKQQYPAHPPSTPDAARSGETTSARDPSPGPEARTGVDPSARPRSEPQLPHEHDESSHSQASAAPGQRDVGKKAYADEIGPGTDTDRGPVLDQVYNDRIAPDRSSGGPRG